MTGPPRTLVVDADIAFAAGPDPRDRPWSDRAKDAHDVLEAVRSVRSYCVAFDATLLEEWKRRQGRTAQAWFAAMLSAGRVVWAEVDAGWLLDLVRRRLPEQEHRAAAKDLHLVALALDPGDERVLSNDAKAGRRFRRLDDDRLASIHWVAASGVAVGWLQEGAPDRPEWQLGGSGARG